jgi:hypothetical protein
MPYGGTTGFVLGGLYKETVQQREDVFLWLWEDNLNICTSENIYSLINVSNKKEKVLKIVPI